MTRFFCLYVQCTKCTKGDVCACAVPCCSAVHSGCVREITFAVSCISFYCMGVSLCLYRTTWTACRYFRIAFIYLISSFYFYVASLLVVETVISVCKGSTILRKIIYFWPQHINAVVVKFKKKKNEE